MILPETHGGDAPVGAVAHKLVFGVLAGKGPYYGVVVPCGAILLGKFGGVGSAMLGKGDGILNVGDHGARAAPTAVEGVGFLVAQVFLCLKVLQIIGLLALVVFRALGYNPCRACTPWGDIVEFAGLVNTQEVDVLVALGSALEGNGVTGFDVVGCNAIAQDITSAGVLPSSRAYERSHHAK